MLKRHAQICISYFEEFLVMYYEKKLARLVKRAILPFVICESENYQSHLSYCLLPERPNGNWFFWKIQLLYDKMYGNSLKVNSWRNIADFTNIISCSNLKLINYFSDFHGSNQKGFSRIEENFIHNRLARINGITGFCRNVLRAEPTVRWTIYAVAYYVNILLRFGALSSNFNFTGVKNSKTRDTPVRKSFSILKV